MLYVTVRRPDAPTRIHRAICSEYLRMRTHPSGPRQRFVLPTALAMLALCVGQARLQAAEVAAAPFKAPYVPSSDAEPLQEVPSVIRLADAYVDYSRQVGDAHYAGYAEAVIAPWMSEPRTPAVALVTQATILQYRHQFDDARALLDAALRSDPRNGPGEARRRDRPGLHGLYQQAGEDGATANRDRQTAG